MGQIFCKEGPEEKKDSAFSDPSSGSDGVGRSIVDDTAGKISGDKDGTYNEYPHLNHNNAMLTDSSEQALKHQHEISGGAGGGASGTTTPSPLDTTNNTNNTEDDGTVLKLQSPSTSQRVTLIGTCHISQESSELVESVIESVRPDAVLVELDRTCLHGHGITEADLGDDFVAAGDDIRPPLLQDDIEAQKAWWTPAMDLFLDVLSQLGRKLLTRKYDADGDQERVRGGGEFFSAIQTSKRINPDTKIILGDRSSVVTMRRIAELAMRSGDPWGIFNRLKEASKAATKQLKAKVRENLGRGTTGAEFKVAMVEAVNSDANFRKRLFGQFEEAVPQFMRALLTERDYIMAEAILQEKDAKHIIAVVGLAHVPGIAKNLRQAGFENCP